MHVSSLSVDANHDGTIDRSFTGPDLTSAQKPFVFWVNNDYDRGHAVDGSDWEEDDLTYRDIEIQGQQTYLDFHNCIVKAFEFDGKPPWHLFH